MTSRTCRLCLSRWTKRITRETFIDKRAETLTEKERKKERKRKRKKKMRANSNNGGNEKKLMRYEHAHFTAQAFRVVHSLILTDKNAVFRLALYPPLRPSAVRVRIMCVRMHTCLCMSRLCLSIGASHKIDER